MDTILSRTIRIGIIVILIAVPLVYSKYTQNSFTAPKRAFFEIAMAALLTLFALQVVFSPERVASRGTPLDMFLLAWLAWQAIACLFSLDRQESFGELVYFASLTGFFFLITQNVAGRRQLLPLICIIAAVGALEAAYGLAELFGAKLLYEANIRQLTPTREVTTWRWSILGTFGNADHLASYLALSSPLLLGLCALWSGWRRYLFIVALILAITCLIFTGARGSTLAAVIGIAIPLIWSVRKGIRISKRRAALALLAFAMVLAAVFIAKPRIATDMVGRMGDFSLTHPRGSVQFRLLTWRTSLLMIAQRPIRGSGQETFKLLFLPTLAGYLKGGDPLLYDAFRQKMNEAHNEFIQTAVETGIPGLAFLLIFCGFIIAHARRRPVGLEPGEAFFAIAVLGGFIAVLADAFGSISFHVVPTHVAFWAIAAVLVTPPAPAQAPRSRPAWRWGAAVGLIGVAYVTLFTALDNIAFEACFKQGTMLNAAGRYPDALVAFTRALTVKPTSGQIKFYLGSVLIQLGRYEDGLLVLRQSEKNFQDIHLYKNMGVAYERLGKPDLAAEQYRRWKEMGIASCEANNLIALARYRQGRRGEAEALFRETLRVRCWDWIAHATLGSILLDEGRYDEAVEALKPDIFWRIPEAYTLYGVALMKAGRYEEAKKNFSIALEKDPRSVKAHNNLAALFYATGDSDHAMRQWEQVLVLDPDNAIAKKNLEMAGQKKTSR